MFTVSSIKSFPCPIEMLSHCKVDFWLLSSWINRIFLQNLLEVGSFVECLVWRLESLYLSSIRADLCFANTFAGGRTIGEEGDLMGSYCD